MGVGIDQKQRNVESPKSQLSFFCSLVLSYSRKWGGEMGMVGIMPSKPPSPLKTILPWTPWKIVLDLPLH